MRKEGDQLTIAPGPSKSLLALLATLSPIEENLPPIADPPPTSRRVGTLQTESPRHLRTKQPASRPRAG